MTFDEALGLIAESSAKKCDCIDCISHRAILKGVEELRERVRIADEVRDDARRVSQKYLDEKRELQAQLAKVTNG